MAASDETYAFYSNQLGPNTFYCEYDLICKVHLVKEIGSGAFGKVYEARMKDEAIAVKLLVNKSIPEDNDAVREADLLKKCLPSPYIVDYLGHTRLGGFLAIETELLGPTLQDYLHSQSTSGLSLPLDEVLTYSRQLFSAIAYIHGLQLVHSDIKADNICMALGDEQKIKLIDIGCAVRMSLLDAYPLARVANVRYKCPENLLGFSCGKYMDIWAAGVIACLLYMGRHPFYVNKDAALLKVFLAFDLLPSGSWNAPRFEELEEEMDNLQYGDMHHHAADDLGSLILQNGRNRWAPTPKDYAFVDYVLRIFGQDAARRPRPSVNVADNFDI